MDCCRRRCACHLLPTHHCPSSPRLAASGPKTTGSLLKLFCLDHNCLSEKTPGGQDSETTVQMLCLSFSSLPSSCPLCPFSSWGFHCFQIKNGQSLASSPSPEKTQVPGNGRPYFSPSFAFLLSFLAHLFITYHASVCIRHCARFQGLGTFSGLQRGAETQSRRRSSPNDRGWVGGGSMQKCLVPGDRVWRGRHRQTSVTVSAEEGRPLRWTLARSSLRGVWSRRCMGRCPVCKQGLGLQRVGKGWCTASCRDAQEEAWTGTRCSTVGLKDQERILRVP